MIDNLQAQHLAKKFEDKVGYLFEKYGMSVDKLDKENTRSPRPDYLITNASNDEVVVECKYIVSGGYSESGEQISTLNPSLDKAGLFNPTFEEKYFDVFLDAIVQYKSYMKTRKKKKIPFIVAIEADFFAQWFKFIPSDIYGLGEISAVIFLERNHELGKEMYRYSLHDLEKIIKKELKVYKPSPSLRFNVLRNSNAKIRLRAEEFIRNPIIV